MNIRFNDRTGTWERECVGREVERYTPSSKSKRRPKGGVEKPRVERGLGCSRLKTNVFIKEGAGVVSRSIDVVGENNKVSPLPFIDVEGSSSSDSE